MRINLAERSEKHIAGLTDLWSEAFGDDCGYIRSFIESYLIPEYNVPVLTVGGKIASAFYMFEFELCSNRESIGSCAYLYAAATKKEYRNNGYMSKIIAYACDLYCKRGFDMIFLFPQTTELFNFYAKLGFEPLFGYRQQTVDLKGKNEICGQTTVMAADCCTELYEAYLAANARSALTPVKDERFFRESVDNYLESGGNLSLLKDRLYCFYRLDGTSVYVDDMIAKDDMPDNNAEEIVYDAFSGMRRECIIKLPADDTKNYIPIAMGMPLSKKVKNITENEDFLPVYINMFMNY